MNPTPSINVNIAYDPRTSVVTDEAPVPLPCPIPRTVEFTVRLGECPTHPYEGGHCEPMPSEPHRCVYGEHPMRTVRVSCTISGKTWAASDVADVEEHGAVSVDGGPQDAMRHSDIMRACRERWALVKALVLGRQTFNAVLRGRTLSEKECGLVNQRDAVFSALADMARAEDACSGSLDAFVNALGRFPRRKVACGQPRPERPSAQLLADYVERLVEQVGGL